MCVTYWTGIKDARLFFRYSAKRQTRGRIIFVQIKKLIFDLFPVDACPVPVVCLLFPQTVCVSTVSFWMSDRSHVVAISRSFCCETRSHENSQIRQSNQTWSCGQRPRLSPFMLILLIRYFHDFRTSQACHFIVLYLMQDGPTNQTKYFWRKEIIKKQFVARPIT